MTMGGAWLFCGKVPRVAVVSAGRGDLYGVAVMCEVAVGVENFGDECSIAYTGKSREQFTNRDF
jgi:hypothetical protein